MSFFVGYMKVPTGAEGAPLGASGSGKGVGVVRFLYGKEADSVSCVAFLDVKPLKCQISLRRGCGMWSPRPLVGLLHHEMLLDFR